MKFQQSTTITPSSLSHGWHPGYILRIVEEDKPSFFTQSTNPKVWAWYCAIWQLNSQVETQEPEVQIAYCSPKFSPGGGTNKENGQPIAPTKSYEWVTGLLGRPLAKGEQPDIPDGFPCRVKIARQDGKDYVKIVDFEPWPEAPKEWPGSVQKLMQTENKALVPANNASSDDDIPF